MFIESPKKIIQKNDKEIFEFLANLKNFEKLMPKNIDKFKILNDDRFLFALKGMPEIILERKEQTEYNKLVLGATNNKLPFTLTTDIISCGEHESAVTLSFHGEFNAMMTMMVKKPITSFMDTLTQNLQRI